MDSGSRMKTGTIDLDELRGGLDLYRTLESGQSYLWRRTDDRTYGGVPPRESWYYTVLDPSQRGVPWPSIDEPAPLLVRECSGLLEWRSTVDAERAVTHLLRLEDDLDAIAAEAPPDPLVREAYDFHRGMRLVADPPFGTLVSFICSAQMRVSRIHDMVSTIARAYGTPIELEGRTYHTFPTPEELAAATEDELRELGLGYRAPYVVRTAEMVADGVAHPERARNLEYEDAREYLTQFVGVGDKVADCVLLFSLGFDEAVPLDTWIRSAIEEYYPDCNRGNYAETSRAIRERLGGRYAGYAQTYLFHHLRTGANRDN